MRIAYDEACELVAHNRARGHPRAPGIALGLLDEDVAREEIVFFHQLLQEYFAARHLAQAPDPALVHIEWSVEALPPVAGRDAGCPGAPASRCRRWRRPAGRRHRSSPAPMAPDPDAFIRDLVPHNLPLAARCAASTEPGGSTRT